MLIEKKAIKEDLIKSIFIPALSNKPITLIGIPYFMSTIDIFSDNLGFILPIKKPNKINGTISINNLVIDLKSKTALKFYNERPSKMIKKSLLVLNNFPNCIIWNRWTH